MNSEVSRSIKKSGDCYENLENMPGRIIISSFNKATPIQSLVSGPLTLAFEKHAGGRHIRTSGQEIATLFITSREVSGASLPVHPSGSYSQLCALAAVENKVSPGMAVSQHMYPHKILID